MQRFDRHDFHYSRKYAFSAINPDRDTRDDNMDGLVFLVLRIHGSVADTRFDKSDRNQHHDDSVRRVKWEYGSERDDRERGASVPDRRDN